MADDRYGTAARLAALERHVAALTNAVRQQRETMERLIRESRQLRAKVLQLEQQDAWVESYRNDGRDPFAALGAPARDTPPPPAGE